MEKQNSSSKRIYFGLFLILVGSFWVLERLGIIPDSIDDILISWQMLFIGIGIFSIIGGNRTVGTILIVIGGFFLIPEITTIPPELRQIGWPILIIGIGVVLLVTHNRRKNELPYPDSANNMGLDYFDDFVIFGGREIFINSQNFYGGRTTSMFGGAEYDMRQAELSPNGAVIDCLTLFGGCVFLIPPDWNVKNEVTAVFGAFTDKRGANINPIATDPQKTLVIKGFAAFGGVEVKHFK